MTMANDIDVFFCCCCCAGRCAQVFRQIGIEADSETVAHMLKDVDINRDGVSESEFLVRIPLPTAHSSAILCVRWAECCRNHWNLPTFPLCYACNDSE